jgi:hypothetical protein
MRRYLLALAAILAAGSSCTSGQDGPSLGEHTAFATPAGTTTLVDRHPSTTGAPNSTGTGATGAVSSEAGAGFCAQTQVCGQNEHFSPNQCNCVPDETSQTGQISDTGV